jgi:ElaA protein
MNYTQICKAFNDLTVTELYQLLKLRSEVFVVEQNCVFLDTDDKDYACHHLLLFDDDQDLVAYARIVPAGKSYAEASIGRIVSSKKVRGTGVGKILTLAAIDQTKKIYGDVPIRIGAQYYAVKFYEQSGFKIDGEIYDEDGIDHIEMILS